MTAVCSAYFTDTYADFAQVFIPWLMTAALHDHHTFDDTPDYNVDLVVRGQVAGNESMYYVQDTDGRVDWTDSDPVSPKRVVTFQAVETGAPGAKSSDPKIGALASVLETSGHHQYFILHTEESPTKFRLFEKEKKEAVKPAGNVCLGIHNVDSLPPHLIQRFVKEAKWDASQCCLHPANVEADPIAKVVCKDIAYVPGRDNCNTLATNYCAKNLGKDVCACYRDPEGINATVYDYLTAPPPKGKGLDLNKMCYVPDCLTNVAYHAPGFPTAVGCPEVCAEVTKVKGSDYAVITVDDINYELDCSGGAGINVTKVGPHKPDHPGGNGGQPSDHHHHSVSPWVWMALGVWVLIMVVMVVLAVYLIKERRVSQ